MKKRKIINILRQLDTLPLPDKEKILSACPQPSTSDDAALSTAYRRKLRFKPLIAASITIVLLICGLAAYVIAAEVKEFNEAVSFFRDNDLSEVNLTRSEIKAIYRDISTGSFTFNKTAEVIEQRMIKSSVGGYEIIQDAPTPEDLKHYWDYVNNDKYYLEQKQSQNNGGVTYRVRYITAFQDDLGADAFDKSVFEKYQDKKLVWRKEFNDLWIDSSVDYNEKVIVYGHLPTDSSKENSYAWLALIDYDGTILWQTQPNNGSNHERIGAILSTDEKIVIFSRVDIKYLCVSEYDQNGNVTRSSKTEIGNYQIWNTARLGDGYIIQLRNDMNGENARFIKVNSDGLVTDTFFYESNECHYYITDMIEYNNRIYLSAHSVPKLEDEERDAGGRYEIAAVLNYIHDQQMDDITDEEVTKLMRANFTAVLMECDPISGIPHEFYTVQESLGGRLAIDESNRLVWDVESITHSFFSPATSWFSIGSTNRVFSYIFDGYGALLNQEKTEEYTKFYR